MWENEVQYGRGKVDERVEGVATFRDLGRPLYQMDDDWAAMRRKIMRARSIWGIVGTLIRGEGSDPRMAEIFYMAVVQAILLYGSETWVLLGKSVEDTLKLYRLESLFLVSFLVVRFQNRLASCACVPVREWKIELNGPLLF